VDDLNPKISRTWKVWGIKRDIHRRIKIWILGEMANPRNKCYKNQISVGGSHVSIPRGEGKKKLHEKGKRNEIHHRFAVYKLT